MNPTEWTGALTLFVMFASSIVIPEVLRRRRLGTVEQRQTEASWKDINEALVKERNTLQRRLDERDQYYAAQLKLVEDRFLAQVKALQEQVTEHQTTITQQGETIDRLYAERGRRSP